MDYLYKSKLIFCFTLCVPDVVRTVNVLPPAMGPGEGAHVPVPSTMSRV